MTETDLMTNVPGTIKLIDRDLVVSSLSQRGERSLHQELESVLAEYETAWDRAKPGLDRMKATDLLAWQIAVKELTKEMASGARPDAEAVDKARRTRPKVLARELYRRAKPHQPTIKLEELEAVVTTANVEDLYHQLIEALAGNDPKESR